METQTETQKENFSSTELKKFESEIKPSELKKIASEYQELTIAGITDKEGFEKVRNARIELKNKRVFISKTGKAIRDEANDFCSKVIAKEKELIALIEPTEDLLQSREDAIIEEKERIKKEAEEALRQKIEDRINKLRAVNFEIDFMRVQSMTDEEYTVELDSATKVFQAEQERLAEIEKQKQIEAEAEAKRQAQVKAEQEAEAVRLQKIREEQEEKERQLKAEQEKIREAQEKINAEKKAIEDQKIKEAEEKQRAIELEKAKQEAAEKARVEAEEKMKAEELERKEKERLQKLEAERREMLRPDKEKIISFLNSIDGVARPVLTSDEAIKLMTEIEKDLHQVLGKNKTGAENL